MVRMSFDAIFVSSLILSAPEVSRHDLSQWLSPRDSWPQGHKGHVQGGRMWLLRSLRDTPSPWLSNAENAQRPVGMEGDLK